MTDISHTIIPKSDQLNADDFISGNKVIRIQEVRVNPDAKDQPVSIFFEGCDGKPYKPCKSMRRVLVHCWGANSAEYVGRYLELYRDPGVSWAGEKVGGIRIAKMSHIDRPETMALTASSKSRKPFTVQPLKVTEQPQASGNADPIAWLNKWITGVSSMDQYTKLEASWNKKAQGCSDDVREQGKEILRHKFEELNGSADDDLPY